MDRLSTLILSGLYGFILCWMFLTSQNMITLVAPWIQWMIFIGGIILLCLFLFQLIGLFTSKPDSGHHHHHHEGCEHDHEGHVHDENCKHEHTHEDTLDHAHRAGQDCCEHGHNEQWTPIRYIPLVLPAVLFFMGQPSEDMIRKFEQSLVKKSSGKAEAYLDENTQAVAAYNVLSMNPTFDTNISAAVFAAFEMMDDQPIKDPVMTDLGTLDTASKDANLRETFRRARRVELEGEFQPQTDPFKPVVGFQVVRFRVACCLSDARSVTMLAIIKKPLPAEILNTIKSEKGRTSIWVRVQGKVDFVKEPDGKYSVVMKPAVLVERKNPPVYRYIN